MAKLLSQEEVDAFLHARRAGPSELPPLLSPRMPPPADFQSIPRDLLEIKGAEAALEDQENPNAAILRELDRMKAMLDCHPEAGMSSGPLRLPPALLNLYGRLAANDVEPSLALYLCEAAQRALPSGEGREGAPNLDPGKARLHVRRIIAALIPVAGPIQLEPAKTRIIALMGPAGAGKTAILAKLAGYAQSRLKQKVAFAALGACRLTAVDRLQECARILQAPFHVAPTVEDLRSVLRFHQDRSLVLLSASGLNPKNEEALMQFRGLLDELSMCEIHLALPATAKPRDLAVIAQRYACLRPTRIIFSKLDETATFGPILETLVRVRQPLSYLDAGQEAPDALEAATSHCVADLILPPQE